MTLILGKTSDLCRKTLHEHEQAWGSYKYAGRVQSEDGLILLKREAVSLHSLLV